MPAYASRVGGATSMSEPMHGGFQKAMVGATADFKAQLRQQVDPVTYDDILTTALRILEHVPEGELILVEN